MNSIDDASALCTVLARNGYWVKVEKKRKALTGTCIIHVHRKQMSQLQ